MTAAAVIVAAGTGSRMGKPKQFLLLAGKPMVRWTLEAFLKVPEIGHIVVVLSPDHLVRYGARLKAQRVHLVAGGRTRLESVRIGLAAIGDPELVAIHDGARPLISVEMIQATLKAAKKYGAAVPAVKVTDTLKEGEGFVIKTPDRSKFWSAQTPQCYRTTVLRNALSRNKIKDATDESQLVEADGTKVKIVPSTYDNLKVTTPADLVMAESLLLKRGEHSAVPASCTGFGYDIHRLEAGRKLYLGGMEFDHPKGMMGHSDGDAVLHACCDAILGAAGAGELGEYFPPDATTAKGIRSTVMTRKVCNILAGKGGAIEHLDVTIVAEEPKLRPVYDKLKNSIAQAFAVSVAKVNVKSKTNEGLGEIGRGEAIACYAVATCSFNSSTR